MNVWAGKKSCQFWLWRKQGFLQTPVVEVEMKVSLSGRFLLSAHWENTDIFFQAAELSLMLFPHISFLLKALPSTHSLSFQKPSLRSIFPYELTLVDDGARRGSGPRGPHGIDIALSLTGVEGWEVRAVVLILQRNRRLATSFSEKLCLISQTFSLVCVCTEGVRSPVSVELPGFYHAAHKLQGKKDVDL